MDLITAIVVIVLGLALGVPTLGHLLEWADKYMKLRINRTAAALPAAEWEAMKSELEDLRLRIAQTEVADERVAALEEQVRFLERLLTEGEARPPLPPSGSTSEPS